ncbi:hypothetical protein [Emcibacter sp. SYSU 3D8]|uniref:hypothetical protein n=1 Tax=Emcibacter sp. SYSU 3D8 TaxID=3133969 RepID=UPI0031FF2CEF
MARRKRRSGAGSQRLLIASVLVFVVALGVFLALRTELGSTLAGRIRALVTSAGSPCCAPAEVLSDFQLPVVAYVVSDLWRDGRARDLPLPPRLSTPAQAVNVALVSKGRVVREAWMRDGTVLDALTAALTRFRSQMPADERADIDSIELFLGHSFRKVSPDEYDEQIFAAHHRGIRGLEIVHGDTTQLHSPLEVLRRNVTADRLVRDFAAAAKTDRAEILQKAGIRVFDGEQVLVRVGAAPKGFLLERGNVYVKPQDVTADAVRGAVRLATGWLTANVGISGELPYGFRPSELKPLEGNNAIRQWMATIALERAAQPRLDPQIWELAERNLAFNMADTYRQEGTLGIITGPGDTVSLGAVALAGLALAESHAGGRYGAEQAALSATIDRLHTGSGAFRTYLRPASRTGNQNFYPGEALLYWATRYDKQPDPALLDRFMTSFRHYRQWYRDQRNPAFIGWHTQADYRIWKHTSDSELRDFVFEMNDWLVGLQQWAIPTEYRDLMGRFYAPGAGFGPPHASSTGIYLEGLVDAFRLARESGDPKRAELYRLAILRGLRDVLQLQFADEIDMFYVPPGFRKFVEGGIRTTGYDNVIRIDNVQHNLMAMLNVLQSFRPEDYKWPTTTQ